MARLFKPLEALEIMAMPNRHPTRFACRLPKAQDVT
jgi:hypothetical protein